MLSAENSAGVHAQGALYNHVLFFCDRSCCIWTYRSEYLRCVGDVMVGGGRGHSGHKCSFLRRNHARMLVAPNCHNTLAHACVKTLTHTHMHVHTPTHTHIFIRKWDCAAGREEVDGGFGSTLAEYPHHAYSTHPLMQKKELHFAVYSNPTR